MHPFFYLKLNRLCQSQLNLRANLESQIFSLLSNKIKFRITNEAVRVYIQTGIRRKLGEQKMQKN